MLEVRNLVWDSPERTSFSGEIYHSSYGWIPYGFSAEDTGIGAEIWANRDSYQIADYVAIPMTEEEKQAQALAQAKKERAEAVSKLTVTVDGMVFDADETSQNRMSRVVAGAQALGIAQSTTQVWVLADNTVATPTVKQLAQALKLAGEAQTALWTVPYQTETPEGTS